MKSKLLQGILDFSTCAMLACGLSIGGVFCLVSAFSLPVDGLLIWYLLGLGLLVILFLN